MQKIILTLISLIFLTLVLFTQCTKEEKEISTTNGKKVVAPEINEKSNNIQDNTIDKPFSATITKLRDEKFENISRQENINSKTIQEIEKDINSKTIQEIEKDILEGIQTRMMIEFEIIPSCLEEAENKKEALECHKEIERINRELQAVLHIEIDPLSQKQEIDLTWNETIKNNMIKEIDTNIPQMQEMFTCIQDAENDEEQLNCLKPDNVELAIEGMPNIPKETLPPLVD